MSNDLTYKGFTGSVEYNSEDRILFGKVLFIDSLLMYHGSSVQEIEDAFKETVDAYLAHCKKNGKEPNKPYSGSFNVRTSSELHRQAAQMAYKEKTSLNDIVVKSLAAYVSGTTSVNHNLTVNLSVQKDHPITRLVANGSSKLSDWGKTEYATATRH